MNIIEDAVQKTETDQFNHDFIQAWEKYGYSYDEAQLKAEKANLNFHDILIERSQSLEEIAWTIQPISKVM